MTRAENKSMRLSQIEALLIDNPQGLSQAELARRLEVHRSTILRNLADIHAPIYEENVRLFIDREAYLVNLRLNLHEALSIHLAGRFMATCMDRRNPHVASALRKLGISLEKLAPLISHFVRSSANTFDDDSKRQDPHYLQVLEKLTLAWAEKRKVQLWYRGAEGGVVKEYSFCPYFVEVSAVGQAIYAIGRIEPEKKMRTFKIERVERIELLKDTYPIPRDFDPDQLLDQAWGIWFTEQQPLKIQLRFSQRVAQRVRETRWHPTEQVTEQPDGSLLWCASIAEPREMLPWIRGWGADVEVLEPQELRETIKTEAKNLAMIYQMKIAEE
jgi:CRISPR-associated endonuclease/helicase Cas3